MLHKSHASTQRLVNLKLFRRKYIFSRSLTAARKIKKTYCSTPRYRALVFPANKLLFHDSVIESLHITERELTLLSVIYLFVVEH